MVSRYSSWLIPKPSLTIEAATPEPVGMESIVNTGRADLSLRHYSPIRYLLNVSADVILPESLVGRGQ